MVTSVSFSSNGRRIVTGSRDNTLKVWDAESGEELRTLNRHTNRVTSVSFSPNGQRIVSGNNTIKVWDAQSGEELRTLRGHTGSVRCVSFSPDGKQLTTEDSTGTQIIWSTETWERISDSDTQPNPLSIRTAPRRDLSPDGRWLVLAVREDIRIIDLNYELPRVRKFREIQARPNPAWNQEQAETSAKSGDLFAELFHRAWLCKINPEDLVQLQAFQELHKKFLKDNEQTDPIIPKVVIEALAIPLKVQDNVLDNEKSSE